MVAPSLLWTIVAVPSVGTVWGPIADRRLSGSVHAQAAVDPLAKVEALRDLLTVGGRSLAQGALGWLLARSPSTIPIPGFKTVDQVTDNLRAMELGPLTRLKRTLNGVLAISLW